MAMRKVVIEVNHVILPVTMLTVQLQALESKIIGDVCWFKGTELLEACLICYKNINCLCKHVHAYNQLTLTTA